MSDVITVTSHRRHSLTSSPASTSDVIRTGVDEHLTTVSGGISSTIHNNVVKTTSVLLPVSLITSGDHVTTPPDVTTSTGSVVDETPHSGRSANYVGERVTVVIVICVFVLVLILVITFVIVVLVRYVRRIIFSPLLDINQRCQNACYVFYRTLFHVYAFLVFNAFISPTFY